MKLFFLNRTSWWSWNRKIWKQTAKSSVYFTIAILKKRESMCNYYTTVFEDLDQHIDSYKFQNFKIVFSVDSLKLKKTTEGTDLHVMNAKEWFKKKHERLGGSLHSVSISCTLFWCPSLEPSKDRALSLEIGTSPSWLVSVFCSFFSQC